jgi:hypothetical protein
MRDFRDAKAMAHTLRASLAAKGLKITISQSLELIAEAFGAADWNTLTAAIRAEAVAPRKNASPPPSPTAEGIGVLPFSAELKSTLRRALAYANQRKHKYATLEHLLLALTDDVHALAVMKACNVDLDALRENLASYIDTGLNGLVIEDTVGSRQTAGFQRAVHVRAELQAQESASDTVTGASVLVAIFAERESPAAHFLQQQGMTRGDAVNFILHGIVKEGGDAAAWPKLS